ncbi:melanization protease 1-like [Orussus abietinus]|uniref:melanization protease 1-like n=1 Tax=Orussus abietinus TaxID=222816 RepID=UPI0006264C16|nr:melanization protease 1-like [Orussus abietinus]
MNANHGFLVLAALLLGQGATGQNRCSTPLQRPGTCINIRSCPKLLDILKQPRPLPQASLNFLRNSQCGFEGLDPKVCCEDQVTETTPQSRPLTPTPIPSNNGIEPPDVSNHPNLSLLPHDICGPIRQQKIFNGNKTGVFDFPWMALVAYKVQSKSPEFRCGGSIINKRYILTAAHCVTQLPSGLSLLGVRVGEHDLSTEVDCDRDEKGFTDVCAEKYQDFGIESVHFHFNYSRVRLHEDVALIRVNRDIDFRPLNVRPICMPVGEAKTMSFKKGVVTGWGATEFGPRSQDLLMVLLPIVSNEECKSAYVRNAEIWYKQMCAGGSNRMDSCLGDSGGPLQVPGIYNGDARTIQYGIVSFGLRSCGTDGFPGVYTRVPYYMDWILNTIKE